MHSCGIDIVKVSRIKDAIEANDKFIKKVYSDDEIEYCNVKNVDQRYLHYAGRFAAKEAIYKALTNSEIKPEAWNTIEIISLGGKLTKPIVRINGEILSNIDVSISHDTDYATAVAILDK
ncbi:MAG: holo-ACP synthase [Clostridia bacterium]